jgi:hypothetical protein
MKSHIFCLNRAAARRAIVVLTLLAGAYPEAAAANGPESATPNLAPVVSRVPAAAPTAIAPTPFGLSSKELAEIQNAMREVTLSDLQVAQIDTEIARLVKARADLIVSKTKVLHPGIAKQIQQYADGVAETLRRLNEQLDGARAKSSPKPQSTK